MGRIWGQQDPGGPHVGPMNFAIWGNIWNFLQNAHIVYVDGSEPFYVFMFTLYVSIQTSKS